jgi:hypothetical protein
VLPQETMRDLLDHNVPLFLAGWVIDDGSGTSLSVDQVVFFLDGRSYVLPWSGFIEVARGDVQLAPLKREVP